MKALGNGGKLQLEFQDDKQSYTAEFPPSSVTGLNLDFYDLVQKLCLVQDKTSHILSRFPKKEFHKKTPIQLKSFSR